MLRFLVSIIFSLFLLTTTAVPAMAVEEIKNFDAQLKIMADGRLEIVETINYDFGLNQKHGIFRKIPVKEDKAGAETIIIIIIIAVIAFFYYFLLPIWVVYKWFCFGRDPKIGVTGVSFEPPKDGKGRMMKPAEVGILVDESADNRDISATIVDLAIRGYLKIKEEKKNEHRLIKLKNYGNDANLKLFEKKILAGLFENREEVTTKELSDDFYQTAENVKDNLYEEMTEADFFVQNPKKVRTKYYVLGGMALATLNLFLGIISFVFGKNMPRKTVFGTEALLRALSLKRFLSSQERQLEFQVKNWYFFEKLLPFAIVFGVEKIWAERFKNLSVKLPDWYESSSLTQFNSVLFVNNLTHSVSSFSSMSMSPTNSSSGFSSGFSGGSSGGGGGGGGGGSW